MRIEGSHASFITDFSLELLCELSWMNFGAVNLAARASQSYVTDLMTLCGNTGVYYSFCASEIMLYPADWSEISDVRDRVTGTPDLCPVELGKSIHIPFVERKLIFPFDRKNILSLDTAGVIGPCNIFLEE